jgi:hypothetical protein
MQAGRRSPRLRSDHRESIPMRVSKLRAQRPNDPDALSTDEVGGRR